MRNLPSQLAQRYPKCIKSNKIVIWHDCINNPVSKHPNHPNRPIYTVPRWIADLNNWKHKIAEIVYLRRVGTPNILAELQSTKILVLQVTTHLLTQRVLRDYRFVEDLVKVHPSYLTELKLLDIIVRNQGNLRNLIEKRRTHKRKPSMKARAKEQSTST